MKNNLRARVATPNRTVICYAPGVLVSRTSWNNMPPPPWTFRKIRHAARLTAYRSISPNLSTLFLQWIGGLV